MKKKLTIFLVHLELFVSCFAYQGCCCTSQWVQINGAPVCFQGKHNHPGTFQALHSGFAAAVKLVHRSGVIRCVGYRKHNSHFGCHLWKGIENHPLNVVVTNSKNRVKFPTSEVSFSSSNSGYWYGLDGVNAMSKEIVLQHGFDHPYYINHKQTLRVWYGEDLLNKGERDNVGRVCVDVLAYFM